MSTTSRQRPDQEAGPQDQRTERQAAAVCLAVIRALGRPPDLLRISAVRLWENCFRVNVQTGADACSVHIPHSYFVTADAEGKVLASVPQLARVY